MPRVFAFTVNVLETPSLSRLLLSHLASARCLATHHLRRPSSPTLCRITVPGGVNDAMLPHGLRPLCLEPVVLEVFELGALGPSHNRTKEFIVDLALLPVQDTRLRGAAYTSAQDLIDRDLLDSVVGGMVNRNIQSRVLDKLARKPPHALQTQDLIRIVALPLVL